MAFHVVAWLAALASADALPSYAGGLGWPLAALHAVTLGVLAMTAIGASVQLFPVATRRPVAHERAGAAIFWLYAPGVAAVVVGMGLPSIPLLAAGGAAAGAALALFAFILGRNLADARGMPLVVAYGAVAAAALVATLVTAALAVAAYAWPSSTSWPRASLLALHVVLAAYGFMGMLALGLAHVLVPLFALGEPPAPGRARASLALALVALVLAAGGAIAREPALLASGAATGVVAAVLHVMSMRAVVARGLRRELGTGFTLVRLAWAAMIASLALGVGTALALPLPRLATLFGATLVVGWLLTFVLGMLERIVPFLAAMHAGRGQRRPPTPSSLTDARSLALHARLHGAALALLAASIVLDRGGIALAAAAAGLAGSVAYALSFARAARAIAPTFREAAR